MFACVSVQIQTPFLPCVCALPQPPPHFSPFACVLLSSSCLKIHDECVKFGRASRVRVTCCFGGAPKSNQIRALQSGIDVLVATPGRLNDLLQMRKANVSQVK